MVVNASGTVTQRNHYYPFGTAFAENTTDEQKQQPYKYNGKELDQMHGLNLYDYSARYYESAVGRFTNVDPLAEKYYNISPYAYCNNNPLRFIDPTGMEFTEAAWKQVNRLINDINKRQAKNSQEIAKRQAELDAGGLLDKQTAKLHKEIDKFSGNSSDLEGARGEIATLAASNQMYDIKMDNSMNISGAIPGAEEERGGAAFNFNNGNFEITLGNSSLGMLAHELRHAYQFETGAFSSGYMRDGTPFYDKADEWEAYSRGTLFGAGRISSLPSIYNNLQSGPIDVTKLAPIILSSPTELQKLANRTRSAFRVNGVTYQMQGGRS